MLRIWGSTYYFIALMWVRYQNPPGNQSYCDLHGWIVQASQQIGLQFLSPPTVGWISTGGWGSSFLSQPAEWWEPGTGQLKMLCYFYHSVLNLRAVPWRPVAGSSPQAAEFNPRTALPRCDGKHLASCLTTRPGCPTPMLLKTPTPSAPPVDLTHR